jgi:ribosomal protein S12
MGFQDSELIDDRNTVQRNKVYKTLERTDYVDVENQKANDCQAINKDPSVNLGSMNKECVGVLVEDVIEKGNVGKYTGTETAEIGGTIEEHVNNQSREQNETLETKSVCDCEPSTSSQKIVTKPSPRNETSNAAQQTASDKEKAVKVKKVPTRQQRLESSGESENEPCSKETLIKKTAKEQNPKKAGVRTRQPTKENRLSGIHMSYNSADKKIGRCRLAECKRTTAFICANTNCNMRLCQSVNTSNYFDKDANDCPMEKKMFLQDIGREKWSCFIIFHNMVTPTIFNGDLNQLN